MDFQLDWLYLYIQVTVLLTIPIREIFRKQGRNLYAILIPITMLILVQGQAWWMLNKFEVNNLSEMQHIFQTINIDGLRRANFYMFLTTIVFVITYCYLTLRERKINIKACNLLSPPLAPGAHNFIFSIFILLSGLLVINTSGGLEAAITNPGLTFTHGLVFFLMLLWIGKFPALNNIAVGRKNNWMDISLFIFVIAIFLINSRILVSFTLFQLVLLYNYCRKEINRRSLLYGAIVLFIIFFVFGMYRHYIPQYEDIQHDMSAGFVADLFSIENLVDWFYGINVEGFASLAGLLSYESNQGGINYDFGLSNLSALFQFIPSSLRFSENLIFKDMQDLFSSLYPYVGSVVPSGMENAYAHFGLTGLIGLGALLGFLIHWFHSKMSDIKTDRLLLAILSIQFLQLIRGSFYVLTFYFLAEIIILFLYRSFLNISNALPKSSLIKKWLSSV